MSGNAVDAAVNLITCIIGKIPQLIDPLGSVGHYGNQTAIGAEGVMPGIPPDFLIINVPDHDLHKLAGAVAEIYRRIGDVGFRKHNLHRLIRTVNPPVCIKNLAQAVGNAAVYRQAGRRLRRLAAIYAQKVPGAAVNYTGRINAVVLLEISQGLLQPGIEYAVVRTVVVASGP